MLTDSDKETRPDPKQLAAHCETVVDFMIRNRVTPFLGAGINLADRDAEATYEPGKNLPSGAELAKNMAAKFEYPWDDKDNLLRVSWWANEKSQAKLLYYLHDVFNANYQPTSVHRFLASLPKRLAAKGKPDRYQIIITTNYDDVLERALEDEQEKFDILYFEAKVKSPNVGCFLHVPYKQEPRVIPNPHTYMDLPINPEKNERTLIVKIHGAIDRRLPEASSFVVTEDDYIEYLARATPAQPMPKALLAQLQINHFLFLGYSLKDWNMRVFLRRIAQERPLEEESWAVMREAEAIEKYFWEKNKIEFWKMPLKEYIDELNKHL